MAIRQLTDEQVRTWTREEKDRWWLKNVWRGDMPQLTLRAAITGMILGGVMSITNLYIGAKTGWSVGVGMTSVILAYGIFRLLSALGLARNLTILENNCTQSIATAGGYITMPLIAAFPAYMMITGEMLPLLPVTIWIITVSILGVLFAFPLKRRFINDEQQPFPEGRAVGIVLDALHSTDHPEEAAAGRLNATESEDSEDLGVVHDGAVHSVTDGMLKAKLLAIAAGFSALWVFMSNEGLLGKLHFPGWLRIPETLDGWIYDCMEKPFSLGGVDLRQLSVVLESDITMFGLGGLVGIRTGLSLLIGAIINYCILAPWMIGVGDITCAVKDGISQEGVYGFREIVKWGLWGGVSMMTTASLWSFFADPKSLLAAFRFRGKKKTAGGDADVPEDCLRDIELPSRVFLIGIPLIGGLVVWESWAFFGVPLHLGIVAIPLIFVFTMIAVHATALTAITPVGSLGKLTQLTFAGLAPGNMTTNIAAAGITASVSSNASNLLMDIKPGYMLGAKPRQQAIGHVLGIIAGACVAVPVWSVLFLQHGVDNIVTKEYPMPSALTWEAVARLLSTGLSTLPISAAWAAIIGGILGIVMEQLRRKTHGRFWLSPVGVGLACLLNFSTSLTMFLGAFFFWTLKRIQEKKPRGCGWVKLFAENEETISGGLIAGAALIAVVIQFLMVFVFKA